MMRLRPWMCGVALGTAWALGCQLAEVSVAGRQVWPTPSSPPGFLDLAQEALVAERLASLDLEQKVRQTIQAGLGSIRPEDLAEWPVGSIVIGGNGGPEGQERAPAAAWAELTRRFSGRPRQPDAALDASSAFVAAWLPGAEGGGVVDVLLGDADLQGESRY